jgi:integrase
VSLLSGVRTEEARALHWDHVVASVDEQWQPVSKTGFDHQQVAVFVWRAERAGGDTKTPKSRRTLALPQKCVEALREHRVRQVKDRLSAGPLWKDHDLVFASAVGTPQDVHNVRRQFRVIIEAAGLGKTWGRGRRRAKRLWWTHLVLAWWAAPLFLAVAAATLRCLELSLTARRTEPKPHPFRGRCHQNHK